MMEKDALIHQKKNKKKKKTTSGQIVSFVIIGGLTLIYCIVELAAALYLHSLVLLSDGFHNLSDVVSLYIAFWAQRAAQRDSSDAMSYGWARTEILGGLTNGCFLLSLCMYVALEAVPRIIEPEPVEEGLIFMIVAAAGLFLNIVGTITFAFVGISHGHSHSHGHGHGHGGGHAHSHSSGESSHSHDQKKVKSPAAKRRTQYTKSVGDVLLEGDADASALAHAYAIASDQDKNHQHGVHKENADDGHSHGHDHKKDKAHKKDKKKGDDEHSHGHHDAKEGDEHSHVHHDEDEDAGHGHGHGGHKEDKKMKKKKAHDNDEHGHSHSHEKKKGGLFSGMSANMFGVFIHFLGDAVSSLFVLATGLIVYFYGAAPWTKYIDPGVSLFICVLIIVTTVPLVKRCSLILLQGTPEEVNIDAIRHKIQKLEGIISVHDLHVWQLVDGMSIASVHLLLSSGTDVSEIVYYVKEVFHKFGIHSSAVQPEFVQDNNKAGVFCEQNCVEECEEDWCCKKGAENHEESNPTYNSINHV